MNEEKRLKIAIQKSGRLADMSIQLLDLKVSIMAIWVGLMVILLN